MSRSWQEYTPSVALAAELREGRRASNGTSRSPAIHVQKLLPKGFEAVAKEAEVFGHSATVVPS